MTDLAGLADFRRRLHARPGTGFDVGPAADAVADRLRRAGLNVTTGVGGAGVVATLDGRGGGGTGGIGLRADLDALPIAEANGFAHRSRTPGAHHGCGHDGHTAMLVGAAETLARRDDVPTTVHFVFQPDEENGRGAQAMIDDGLFDRFPMDAIFGLHNLPGLPVGHLATRAGTMTAFEENFEIVVHGRGGHASAPQATVDPVVVAAELVLALQTIVARALPPADHGVVSVTEIVTDGARNVIPSTVTIRGDVRGHHDAVSATVRTRMGELSAGIAAAHGATATVTYARSFPPVVNADAPVARALAAASEVGGASVDPACAPLTFSEDFARYLAHRPGCFVLLGNGTDGHHGAPLHSPHYDFNDAALAVGVAFWTRLALATPGS